jgi:hypothetical protein
MFAWRAGMRRNAAGPLARAAAVADVPIFRAGSAGRKAAQDGEGRRR